MPAKRAVSNPVTEAEVCEAVKKALLTAFGDWPLDPHSAGLLTSGC